MSYNSLSYFICGNYFDECMTWQKHLTVEALCATHAFLQQEIAPQRTLPGRNIFKGCHATFRTSGQICSPRPGEDGGGLLELHAAATSLFLAQIPSEMMCEHHRWGRFFGKSQCRLGNQIKAKYQKDSKTTKIARHQKPYTSLYK